MIIPFQAKLAIIGVCVAVTFYTGWSLRSLYADREHAKELEAQAKEYNKRVSEHIEEERRLRLASQTLEQGMASLRAQKQKTKIIKVKEYEKPIYTNCAIPADGLRIVKDSATEINRTRTPR